MDHANEFAVVLTGTVVKFAARALGRVPGVGPFLVPIAIPALAEAIKLGTARLEEIHAQALVDRDYLTATLTKFRLDLDHGVKERLLVKSRW